MVRYKKPWLQGTDRKSLNVKRLSLEISPVRYKKAALRYKKSACCNPLCLWDLSQS
jgi:hypothetical protein